MVSRKFFSMEAIRDLSRLRGALTRGVRVNTRAMAVDDLDFGMPL